MTIEVFRDVVRVIRVMCDNIRTIRVRVIRVSRVLVYIEIFLLHQIDGGKNRRFYVG